VSTAIKLAGRPLTLEFVPHEAKLERYSVKRTRSGTLSLSPPGSPLSDTSSRSRQASLSPSALQSQQQSQKQSQQQSQGPVPAALAPAALVPAALAPAALVPAALVRGPASAAALASTSSGNAVGTAADIASTDGMPLSPRQQFNLRRAQRRSRLAAAKGVADQYQQQQQDDDQKRVILPEPEPEPEPKPEPELEPESEAVLEPDPAPPADAEGAKQSTETMVADPFADGDDPDIPGVYRMVRAHSAYTPTSHQQYHSLAVGEVIALTAVRKNGWSEGFKMSDSAHTHKLFPSSHVQVVRVEASPSPRVQKQESTDNHQAQQQEGQNGTAATAAARAAQHDRAMRLGAQESGEMDTLGGQGGLSLSPAAASVRYSSHTASSAGLTTGYGLLSHTLSSSLGSTPGPCQTSFFVSVHF
jgi:hypothetical protein